MRDKGWTPAGDIEPGDELKSHDGQWIPLDSRQLTDSIVTVYNMRVAEDHTYFVGSPVWGFTVWAHNTCDVSLVTYIPPKKQNQVIARKWTKDEINHVVNNPYTTRKAINKQNNMPATAYYNKDSSHIVREDHTGLLIHASGSRHAPQEWIHDSSIINPYYSPISS